MVVPLRELEHYAKAQMDLLEDAHLGRARNIEGIEVLSNMLKFARQVQCIPDTRYMASCKQDGIPPSVEVLGARLLAHLGLPAYLPLVKFHDDAWRQQLLNSLPADNAHAVHLVHVLMDNEELAGHLLALCRGNIQPPASLPESDLSQISAFSPAPALTAGSPLSHKETRKIDAKGGINYCGKHYTFYKGLAGRKVQVLAERPLLTVLDLGGTRLGTIHLETRDVTLAFAVQPVLKRPPAAWFSPTRKVRSSGVFHFQGFSIRFPSALAGQVVHAVDAGDEFRVMGSGGEMLAIVHRITRQVILTDACRKMNYTNVVKIVDEFCELLHLDGAPLEIAREISRTGDIKLLRNMWWRKEIAAASIFSACHQLKLPLKLCTLRSTCKVSLTRETRDRLRRRGIRQQGKGHNEIMPKMLQVTGTPPVLSPNPIIPSNPTNSAPLPPSKELAGSLIVQTFEAYGLPPEEPLVLECLNRQDAIAGRLPPRTKALKSILLAAVTVFQVAREHQHNPSSKCITRYMLANGFTYGDFREALLAIAPLLPPPNVADLVASTARALAHKLKLPGLVSDGIEFLLQTGTKAFTFSKPSVGAGTMVYMTVLAAGAGRNFPALKIARVAGISQSALSRSVHVAGRLVGVTLPEDLAALPLALRQTFFGKATDLLARWGKLG